VTLHSVSELSIHRTGISPNSAARNIDSKYRPKETTILKVLVFSLDPGVMKNIFLQCFMDLKVNICSLLVT
jgi:hypothetical protein